MKKLIFFALFLSGSLTGLCDTIFVTKPSLRQWNTNFNYQVFLDHFDLDSLDHSIWDIDLCKGSGGPPKHDILTSNQGDTNSIKTNNSILKLIAKYDFGNTNTLCWEDSFTCNYTTAEISTKRPSYNYRYGVFEAKCKMPGGLGLYPAYWLWGPGDLNGFPSDGFASEIDIAEAKLKSTEYTFNHVFHWWLQEPDTQEEINDGKKNFGTSYLGSWHTYKIVWTPYEVIFYIDGNQSWARSKYYYGTDDGWRNDIFSEQIQQGITYKIHDWFPRHKCMTIFQMQLNHNIIGNEAILPATLEVEYVTVRQFFLSPEITCPEVICSSTSASLDVDQLASNITWNLTPGYMFSGSTSGNGSNATITPSTYNGTGKITYSFQMPSGETFSAEKTFGVKGPRTEDISLYVCKSDGTPAQKVSGTWLMCPNTTYHIYVNNDNTTCSTSGYSWNVPSFWTTFYTYQNMISVNTNSSPGGPVSVQANTCCNNNVTIISTYLGSNYNCGQYYMIISPNPAENETLLSLQSKSEEVKIDERVEWGLEVYDQTQLMVEKKIKLKGENQKLDISGWKEGIYFIRAIYKGEVIESKLAVKK